MRIRWWKVLGLALAVLPVPVIVVAGWVVFSRPPGCLVSSVTTDQGAALQFDANGCLKIASTPNCKTILDAPAPDRSWRSANDIDNRL